MRLLRVALQCITIKDIFLDIVFKFLNEIINFGTVANVMPAAGGGLSPCPGIFLRVGREKFLLAHAKMKVGANVTFVIVILFS